MANTIVQPPIADVASITDPVYAYKSDNGFFSAEFAQTIGTDDAVKFTTNGYSFGWKPQNVIYIDADGNFDVVFGVNAQAVAQVWKNRVSFVGTSQITTDIFDCENNQLKHTIQMVAPPRLPAGYIGTPTQMASGGTITYDPTLAVFADGQTQTTDFEVIGDIGFKDADGKLIYKLPMITVEDADGNTTQGTYKVTFNADGTISFYGMVPWAWLQSAAYPVVIDPTVIVASAYDTSGNGGRKIVHLSNNWIVNVVANSTTTTYWYVSKDNGTTWAQLCSASGPSTGGNFAMASSGTTVYTIITTTTGVQAYKFDASTVTNTAQTVVGSPDTGQSSIGSGSSLVIDGTGKLTAVWVSKNATYPNSNNIRASSSTDGVTWIAQTQLTTFNGVGIDCTNPCVVLRSNNYPTVIYQFTNSGNNYIYSATWNGSSWASPVIVYSGLTYAQSNPCAAVDGNDVIHVMWHGSDATYNSQTQIKYSKSTDGGSTFSAMANITTDNAHPHFSPSVSIDPSNNLYVFFYATDATISSYYNVWKLVYTGTWTATKVTSNTTGHALNAQTLWSKFNMNSSDAVRYMYQDNQVASVKYDSITFNNPPNAPTLTAHASFDATTAQTLAWLFSDPDSGNTQSAYQLQIKDVVAGTNTVDTGKVASTVSSYALAANALAQGKQYQWRVLTYDDSGAVGPFSAYGTFYTAAAPTVTVTTPTANQVITTSSETVTFSYSDPASNAQQSYEVMLYNATGNTLIEDSGTISGTNNQYTLQTVLANNTTYVAKVKATNSKGITSVVASQTFSTSYTPPATATITVTTNPTGAYNTVAVTNPTPTGSQPTVSSNDLYRRSTGTTIWTRIATGIANNGTYKDYAVASGVSYDYYVQTNGSNGTSSQSATASQTVTLAGVWLHDVTDPVGTVLNVRINTPRSEQWTPDSTPMKFAGRTRPVVAFGEQDDYRYQVSLKMTTAQAIWPALSSLARRKTILCVRDSRGRKMFAIIAALPETDEFYGQSVDIEFTEVSFTEGA